MKIFRLFSIAAAALMMAACSTEDSTQQATPGKLHFTATIAAPNSGAGTRTAYTEDTENKKITVAWKVGDEIALVHDKVMDVVKVKTVNADGSATIDGTITSATDEATVQLVYPAARISGVTSDGNPVFDGSVEGKISSQDGTLTYIQNNIDFREGEGQLSVNGTEVTLKKAADMVSSIAIWKLTLQDDAATPAALAATKVTIKSGSDELASTTELSPGASTVYLAVPAATGDITGDICITATTADNDYFYMKEGVALEAKKYYQSTVQMTKGAHLAFLSADYEAKDGAILTGTLDGAHKISIADGATVTLDNATIEGINSDWYQYAGITCLGDATIILKEGTTNTVNGFDSHFPGIQGAAGKTLTITGSGTLNAKSYGTGAGIGSGYGSERACGNIIIEGGTITATGGSSAAGIGSGSCGNCGNISISGGTVTATGGAYGAGIGSGCEGNCGNILISGGTVSATGGQWAAGIGSGDEGSCGNITITTSVTKVTATRDGGLETVGRGGNGSCGTVTIGCTLNSDGNPVGGTTGAISTSPYTYPVPIELSAVTSSQLGWIVGNDGKAYAVEPLPAGVDAVAKICYVGDNGEVAPYNHGLALALTDESSSGMKWEAAKTACNTTKNTSIPVTNARWLLASKDQWGYMSSAVLSNLGLQNKWYWSSTTYSSEPFLQVWAYQFSSNSWSEFDGRDVGVNNRVRACLAF